MTSVLVVEDEKRLAAAIKRGLEAEGYAVDIALNGTDGQWLAEEREYDAIVLDIMLPGLDGYEVCGNLRNAGNWTPILMLTAKDGARDEVRSLDAGADDFLSKPFSFMVLGARIRSLLRRGGKERPPAAGGRRPHPRPRVTRGDNEIELTSREFSVLEFLMRRADEFVSKSEILENVWDFSFEGDPNIVEVYVRRLREKADEPFGRNSITTKRGAGYRLSSDG